MKQERDIRAEIIADEIVELADALDNAQDLDDAWKRINKALQYLSAKDTMFKMKKDLMDAKKEERN
tara:strand:- start:558 stop:755 length:198 start_codon:yes stop_codon:yes gene_type:complete